MDKLSVVIPVFNGERSLGRSLASIKSQTKPVHEVVIVDDGSTDGTGEIIERFSHLLPIKHIKNRKNVGIQVSLRRGVACSSGDIIFRLDSDDFWADEHVEKLTKLFSKPEVVLVSSRVLFINEHGQELETSKLVDPDDIKIRLIWDNPLVHSSTAFRRTTYFEVDGYDLDAHWEDYQLWIKLLTKGKFSYCSEPTAFYTSAPGSLSRINKRQAILNRWVCQKQAHKAFRSVSPIKGSFILALGYFRKVISWLH